MMNEGCWTISLLHLTGLIHLSVTWCESFVTDEKTVQAVVSDFLVIGEAVRNSRHTNRSIS